MSDIYSQFSVEKSYDDTLKGVIERSVDQLLDKDTNVNRPGMLLGNIQSGKTRAFIGIIARAFDKGYEIAVVLTKGTKALSTQTVQRLSNEFEAFIEDDEMKVYDIMALPDDLNDFILEQKLIIVVKKEDDNLRRLDKTFHEVYPQLGNRRTLIIDDEADAASVGYSKKKNEDGEAEMSFNVLARQISQFRSSLKDNSDFLQVTATPYSLYLQPETVEIKGQVFEPVKPAFTELVPIHSAYVGAQYYFENSRDAASPAYYLHFEVDPEELGYMAKTHGTIIKNILQTKKLAHFRFAICTYLVAGAIRRIQEEQSGVKRPYKSSFIIHTETSKEKHANQVEITKALIDAIKDLQEGDVRTLFQNSYDDLAQSVKVAGMPLPGYDEVVAKLLRAHKEVIVRVINSDRDMMAMLDPKSGELKLDSPYNIFIGGQILDRGITIQNLIGFFYGRNPQRMQQDTVMQHSRMYGARSPKDMAVTRFYTTNRIHESMRKMYEIDSALREFFEKGLQDKGVVFIGKDSKGKIIPCSPNKILLSNTITIKGHRRLLPVGFQTKSQTSIKKHIEKIDAWVASASNGSGYDPFEISLDDALMVLSEIQKTFVDEKGDDDIRIWDFDSYIAALKYMMTQIEAPKPQDKLWCVVRTNRGVSRKKTEGRYFNDSAEDGNNEGRIARDWAKEIPCLILTKQNGLASAGWKDAPFYWPILVVQEKIRTSVFSTELIESE